MKIQLQILMYAYFLCMPFISFGQVSQTKNETVGSLVISLPKADLRTKMPQLIKRFKKVPHVIVDGYCEKKNLVFFKTDNQTFFEVLIGLKELDLVYYIRKDINEELLKSCNDLSNFENEN